MDSDSKFLVTGGHDKMVKVLCNLVIIISNKLVMKS